MISVIVPVYKGSEFIDELAARVKKSVSEFSLDYELILVNDKSPDESWAKIVNLCKTDLKVKGLNLSRNFGQHYAISAGLAYAKGDWIVVMDCDLQDLPEEIGGLYSHAIKGFDVVLAVRQDRQDSSLKKLSSLMFYKLLSWLTGVRYDHRIANFGIYSRGVINAVLSMGDSILYFPSMVKWVGFESTQLQVKHSARSEGKSSYSLGKLTNLAFDIILSYSDKPIRLAIKIGLLVAFISIVFAAIVFVRAINDGYQVPGYASIIISIWFFSGMIISIIGIVGLYVSKTFQAAKRRPVYIISDSVNV